MSGLYWRSGSATELGDQGFPEVLQMVERLAREECPDGACPIEPMLDRCVQETVTDLWHASRITRYVPVLALKQVRACMRAGTCEPGSPAP
jgi:hypothetical protein